MKRHVVAALLTFVAVCPFLGYAQNRVTIKTTTAVQGFNPLNPNASSHPVITAKSQTADQLLGDFTVTNYATKEVTSLTYGWRIAAPATCQGSSLPPFWQEERVTVSIPAGKSAVIDGPKDLNAEGTAKQLAENADLHRTPVVLITVGLLTVTYSDGTFWKDDKATTTHTFDGGMGEKLDECKSPATTATINHCGQPALKDFLGGHDIDHQFRKGGGGGSTCFNAWCNPIVVYNGACPFQQCNIVCCGVGCMDACVAECGYAILPYRCGEHYQ
jgi:hypothetical protein